jgi:UDP-N-acetylmuramoyl-L-alanyl-D-glutamate--2,6-diaminopimelate ligase
MPVQSLLLRNLFSELPFPVISGEPDETPITGITADSRKVEPGNLFVACTGGAVDGHLYIHDAIKRSAAAVVGEKDWVERNGNSPYGAGEGGASPYIRVANSRQALAYLAAAFYGYPARKLTMIGVTGTDGKTTTTNLIYHILLEAGMRAGMISTVNAVIGDQVLDTGFHVTTPDAPDIQHYLAMMVDAGLTHVILETTSHGWAQYRVDACEFDIGVVTNITHEHLDYHGSYEAYRAAKARLFTSLSDTLPKSQGNPRLAILNRDDASCAYLADISHSALLTYGLSEGADVCAEDIHSDAIGSHFIIKKNKLRIAIDTQLFGIFNISNCLAALTTTIFGLDIDPQTAAAAIAKFPGVPGRMERIELGQPFTAIVDFAHTPNALRMALETVRDILTTQRVIAIFGSAGLRDQAKRRMMAEVSAELADITIITAEDPRTESLDDILQEMANGARAWGGEEGNNLFCVPDRGEAIRLGVRLAREGDIVIACGKGHEQSMCFGMTEYPWDDRTAMRAAISELLGIPGPEIPYLPTQNK